MDIIEKLTSNLAAYLIIPIFFGGLGLSALIYFSLPKKIRKKIERMGIDDED